MKNSPVLECHYGADVWTNKDMDKLRKTECLCLNCELHDDCDIAKELYDVCKTYDLAVMITRCKYHSSWEGELYD